MKKLNEFISDKLVTEAISGETFKIDLPDRNAWDNGDKTHIWKTFEFPLKKYVIYKDMYHNDCIHFATLDDMVRNISLFSDDFEDFDPKKDILYASDNFKDAIDWYMKKLNIDFAKLSSKFPDRDDLEEEIDVRLKRCADSAWFFAEYGDGNNEDSYLTDTYADVDLKKIKKDPNKWISDMNDNWI